MRDVHLFWASCWAAADGAGWSRRYGGIHFASGDEHAGKLGRYVGEDAWAKARTYINGGAFVPTPGGP